MSKEKKVYLDDIAADHERIILTNEISKINQGRTSAGITG